MSRSDFSLSLLRTAVLVNFAFTARLYDLLRREPTFFTVRNAGPWDIVALVAVLSLLLPGVFVLVEIAVRAAGPKAWKAVHGIIVALLMLSIALSSLRSFDILSWPLLLPAAAIIGGGAAALYLRFPVARRVVTILWPALVIFPGWMLLASPARMAFSGGFDPPAVDVKAARPAPVVLIVFDEFCGMSLVRTDGATPNGKIDAKRFPNFAALAAEGTWFRNATTMSPSTHEAVPCILTGRFPKDPSHPPEVYEYPENIFRLLGRTHAPVVFETETRLCPPHLRNWPAPRAGIFRQLGEMCLDLAAVELHLLLPPDGPLKLPSLDGRWSNFLDEDADESHGHRGFVHRAEQFDEFVSRMQPGEQPGLYVAHVMLPHVPYNYLPSGETYELPLAASQQVSENQQHGLIGLKRHSERWVEDERAVAEAAQRYLLQMEFVDRLIGRLVKHLKDAGMYDDTLIVLTADHGVSFRTGDARRTVTETNYADILSIPLFIKVPHQRQGATSDRNVQSADILPTIASVLGVEAPWHMDGVSALDPSPHAPLEKGLTPEESWERRKTFNAALSEKLETCKHLERLLGRRDDAYDLFTFGPNADIAGRAVEDFPQGEVPDVQVELRGDIRSHCLAGRLVGAAIPSSPADIAVAIDGRIAGVTRTYGFADFQNCWTVLFPSAHEKITDADVAVYLISHEGGKRVLLPLRRIHAN